jgi:hypothetical protein
MPRPPLRRDGHVSGAARVEIGLHDTITRRGATTAVRSAVCDRRGAQAAILGFSACTYSLVDREYSARDARLPQQKHQRLDEGRDRFAS